MYMTQTKALKVSVFDEEDDGIQMYFKGFFLRHFKVNLFYM